MKHRNLLLRYNLQFFAADDGKDAGGSNTDDVDDKDKGGSDDTDQDKKSSGEEEKKTFTQEELDKAIEKRLARERRKWEKESSKGKEDKDETEKADTKAVDKATEQARAAEAKALDLEGKIICYEKSVSKNSVNDVLALAQAYIDDDTDLEDAVEKVVKKYPQFKDAGSRKPGISTGSETKNDNKEQKPKTLQAAVQAALEAQMKKG